MRKILTLTPWIVVCFLWANTHAASFDCKKAKTETEKSICGSDELSKRDEQLAKAYREALSRTAKAGAKQKLQREQREWPALRDARCHTNVSCLKSEYDDRIAQLKKIPAQEEVRGTNMLVKDTASKKLEFRLIYGKEHKVCTAYLERLNSSGPYSEEKNAPHCTRPTPKAGDGFAATERLTLTPEELLKIDLAVEDFLSSHAPGFREKEAELARKLGLRSPIQSPEQRLQSIRSNLDRHPYKLSPLIDIDNDGTPDTIVIWPNSNPCSRLGKSPAWNLSPTYGFVLNSKTGEVDATKTQRIFGHPMNGKDILTYKNSKEPSFTVMDEKFRPVGYWMGAFDFENVGYFDTFYNHEGDIHGRRKDERDRYKMLNTLGVFTQRNGTTAQVCEIFWNDPTGLLGQRRK